MTAFDTWMQDLEARHLSELRFPEVSRALRALSSTYIERRRTIHHGAALAGAGKRAAFALFYGPLHYLIVDEVVRQLDSGTGQGASARRPRMRHRRRRRGVGRVRLTPVQRSPIDRNPWSLAEAARTYRTFEVPVRTRQDDMTSAPVARAAAAMLAAFCGQRADRRRRARATASPLPRPRCPTATPSSSSNRSPARSRPGGRRWQSAFAVGRRPRRRMAIPAACCRTSSRSWIGPPDSITAS